jgi:hypothetical protein
MDKRGIMSLRIIMSIILVLTVLSACNNVRESRTDISESPDAIIHKVVDHFFESHNDFSTQKDAWGGYTMDLTIEAMLFHDIYTGKDLYTKKVLEIMALRNRKPSDTVPFRSQPFCSYNYALFKATGNTDDSLLN